MPNQNLVYKANAPIKQDGVYYYPLTTYDQIIMPDGNKWTGYMQLKNLLDNSNFANPVNQRGETSYTSGYTIDRWRTWEEGQVTVNEDSITTTVELGQYVPDLDANKTYTFIYSDGTSVYTRYAVYDAGMALHWCPLPAGTWKWAALYEGDFIDKPIPPYTPKSYMDELLACYRYFVRITNLGEISFQGYAFNETTARFTIPLPVPMRSNNPKVSIYWRTAMRIFPGDITPSSLASSARCTNHIATYIVYSTDLTPSTPLILKPNAIIEFSANPEES